MKTDNCRAAAPVAERQGRRGDRWPYKSMLMSIPIVGMSKPFL